MTDTHYYRSENGSLIADLADFVLTITINRPEVKNAMNQEGWDGLFDVLRRAEMDEDVRLLVLQGAEGSFCSGADISGVPAGHPLNRIRFITRTAVAIQNFPKPTIAKVEGYAIGAGWNLALCCDLVVAAEDAKFSAIFAKRGLTLDFGGSWLLPRLAGLQQAKRLAFTADFIGAEEARELNLVTWIVPNAQIDGFVAELTAKLAAMPPIALAQNKELLNAGVTRTFSEALDEETRAQAVNYATEDVPLAFKAFKDKSEPEFTGRWAL